MIVSTELTDLLMTNNNPPIAPKTELIIKLPFLPVLSASTEPPKDPIAAPTKNMETMEDHIKSKAPTDRSTLYLECMLSLQKVLII